MINLTVVIDNDEALKKLKELQEVAKKTTSSVVDDSERMDDAWNKMSSTIGAIAAGYSFKEFAMKVVNIRGEVQQLEIAFETMLGSKAKSDALMKEMIDLAAKTPFGLQDVTNAAKQLLAFGSTAEQISGEITMLGDIAAGLSIPLNDMIYLYGTTRTQGKMFTQDLQQFMGRGIPLAEELAKQFNVTKAEVKELVSQGKVGFPEVEKALQGMTGEGGKFGGLMEKQSASISGQISALEDAIYQMFNDIGESNEGLISSIISGAGWVVENYELVLGIISKLIVAYGAYKAAVMTYIAVQRAIELVTFTKGLMAAVKGVTSLTAAWKAMNTAMKKNAIGLIVSVLATAVATIWDFFDGTEKAAKSTERLEGEIGELEQAARDEYTTVNELAYAYEHLATSEEERADIMSQLKDISPDLVQGMENEATAIEALTTNLAAYNEEQLREIQLNAQKDRYLTNATNVRKAQSDKVTAETNLSMDLQYLYGATRDANIDAFKKSLLFRSTEDDNIFGYDESDPLSTLIQTKAADEYAAYIKKVLENTSLTELQKAEKIINWKTADGELAVGDIPGITMATNVGLIKQAEKDLEDSTNIIEAMTLGEDAVVELNDKLEESAETAINLAEAYRTAQQAWLDAKAKVEDANKNRENYTDAQYKQLVADLDSAEKRFKELGGSTSNKTQTNAEKNAKAAAELALKYEYEAQQAVIDMMAEGTEKKVAQIELDYRKRADAITKAEAELVAKQGTALTEAQKALFQTMREGSASDYADAMNAAIFGDTDTEGSAAIQKMEAERKAWNKYLEEYGTFQEKLKAITIRYNEDIANAQTEGERKTLEAERDAALAAFEVQASAWSKDLANKSTTELNKMMKELEKQVKAKQKEFDALESSDSAEAKDYLKTINELKAKIAELKKRLGEANDAVSNKKWAEATQVFQSIGSAATDAADSIAEFDEGLSDALRSIAQLASSATNMIGAIQGVMTAFKEGVSGIEKASAILAIVGASINLISNVIEVFTKKDAEIKEFEQNRIDFLHEYRKMLSELKDSDYESVFGSYQLNKAIDTRKALDELKQMYDEITLAELELFEGAQSVIDNKGNRLYLVKDRDKKKLLEYFDAVKKGYNGLEGMLIKTRDRSGFANFFGALDEYTSLKDLAPELWGEDGLFNVDAARIFLETNTQITDEQRKQIENAIELSDKYNEALGEIDGMISDVFGNLSGDLTDIIFDSVRNGTDAWDEFGKKGSEIIDALGKQMVQELFVQAYLDQYTEDLRNAFLSGDSNQIAEVTNRIFDNMGMMFDGASAAAAAWDANAEAMGFNMDGVGQEATARGFQAMSQDTGDELNGRFTDIQGKTTAINEAVQYIKSLSVSQLQQTTSISETLAQIHNDTSLIEKHTRELSLIREGIDRMNRNIENI